jgi:hypothetical protein
LTDRDVEGFANFDSIKLAIRKPGHPMNGNKEYSQNDQFEDERIVRLESSVSTYKTRNISEGPA